MKKLLLLMIVLTSMQSCGILWEFRSINELEDMTWLASDIQHFNFNIDNDGNYEVIIMIRHLHGFAMESIPVQLTLINSDTVNHETYHIPIRDNSGEYLGEGGGDLWDVDFTAIQSQSLAAGTYHAEISQVSDYDELRLIMEVGLMIKMVE